MKASNPACDTTHKEHRHDHQSQGITLNGLKDEEDKSYESGRWTKSLDNGCGHMKEGSRR